MFAPYLGFKTILETLSKIVLIWFNMGLIALWIGRLAAWLIGKSIPGGVLGGLGVVLGVDLGGIP